MNTSVLLTSHKETARTLCEGESPPSITIDTNYGDYIAEGTIYTTRQSNRKIPKIEKGNILISCVNLNTIYGCLRSSAGWEKLFTPQSDNFWQLVEYINIFVAF